MDRLRSTDPVEQVLVVEQRQAHLGGDLALVRRPAGRCSELVDRALDVTLVLAPAALIQSPPRSSSSMAPRMRWVSEGLELHALL